MLSVCFVSETAHVELKSGRVQAPGFRYANGNTEPGKGFGHIGLIVGDLAGGVTGVSRGVMGVSWGCHGVY